MTQQEAEKGYGKTVMYLGDEDFEYKFCGMYSNASNETLCWLYHEDTEMKFLASIREIELV
jgi:hypothetical protein